MTAAEILEVMADRGAIEQTFKDLKEVWGAGQQQVRNVYASIGAFAVNATMYSVVEAWAWPQDAASLEGRERSPWDTEERRPSHADKRKSLQREVLRAEIRTVLGARADQQDVIDLGMGNPDGATPRVVVSKLVEAARNARNQTAACISETRAPSK